MTGDDRQRLIEDLENLAASSLDPAKQDEILKTIERLSDQWPDDDELLHIRVRYSDMPK
jgi:hypothetical protein